MDLPTESHIRTDRWIQAAERVRLARTPRPARAADAENIHLREVLEVLAARLSCIAPRQDVLIELVRSENPDLMSAALKAHGDALWSDIHPDAIRATLHTCTRPECVDMFTSMHDAGFSFRPYLGELLSCAVAQDMPTLFDWLNDHDLLPTPRAKLILDVVKNCRFSLASRLDAWIEAAVPHAILKEAFIEALVQDDLKCALYLRHLGLTLAQTLGAIPRERTVGGPISDSMLYRRLLDLEGSRHAMLKLQGLEPDRIDILGRPDSATFAGIDLTTLIADIAPPIP